MATNNCHHLFYAQTQYCPNCFPYVFAKHQTATCPDRSKPLARVSLYFAHREVALCPCFSIRFIIAFHPDGDVRRTLYAHTSNAVRTYTERCMHVHRTLYARTPNTVCTYTERHTPASECTRCTV